MHGPLTVMIDLVGKVRNSLQYVVYYEIVKITLKLSYLKLPKISLKFFEIL